MRAPRRSTIVLAAAGVLASSGGAYVGARSFPQRAGGSGSPRDPRIWEPPPRADGVYVAGGGAVQRWSRDIPFDLHLMIFGDSTATGFGCSSADEVPGVLLARGLAEETGKRIRLSTKAISGATSKGLVRPSRRDVRRWAAAGRRGHHDRRQRHHRAQRRGPIRPPPRGGGAVVVVGTCPDFGVITAIPQPLRWTARTRGLRLARAQAAAVHNAGGIPVPLADLLAPEFLQAPELLFSEDKYHPSAAGYALAARQLFPALCDALGEWTGRPVSQLPLVSRAAEGQDDQAPAATNSPDAGAHHRSSGARRGTCELTPTWSRLGSS